MTAALIGVVLGGLALAAGDTQAPDVAAVTARATQHQTLEPTERHRKVSRLVTKFVERSHYSQVRVNDALSSKIFDRYIDSLDGNRMHFLAGDVAKFERYRHSLDEGVSRGQIEAVFEIFRVYKTRADERMEYAASVLESEPDFTIDEDFEFDRTESPWATSVEELDELWRKRVKNDILSLILAEKSYDEAKEVLSKRYQRVVKRVNQINSDDVFETFMNAYAQTLDPHSSYLSPRNSEEYRIQMSLSYDGIGASLQLLDDYVTVLSIIPGGPAAIDGSLKPNDRITAVGQGTDGELVDVIGWRLDDVVQLIRGPGGSDVRLQILPAGAAPGSPEHFLDLIRDEVKLEAQAAQKSTITIDREGQELTIGVIDVPSFYQDFRARASGDENYTSTTRDVRRLIEELREEDGIDGLIIDLRENGGGHLSEATALSGLFIDQGPVVQLRETTGKVQVLPDPDPSVAYRGPLAVLVNRYSASASEIFAAAIQDYGRGVVIGQKTFGKGSVQNLYSLDRYWRGDNPGFGQLTLTIGKYYRVTGESTQHRGVDPDIQLPSLVDAEAVGESTRETALPWDEIRPTNYAARGEVKPDIEALSQTHARRIAEDPNFLFLKDNIAAYEDLRSQKSVSLKLDNRKVERKQARQERLDRENARRVALGMEPLENIEELNDIEPLDTILDEAAQIVGDMADLDHSRSAAANQKPESALVN